jgi:hypothetical protein
MGAGPSTDRCANDGRDGRDGRSRAVALLGCGGAIVCRESRESSTCDCPVSACGEHEVNASSLRGHGCQVLAASLDQGLG